MATLEKLALSEPETAIEDIDFILSLVSKENRYKRQKGLRTLAVLANHKPELVAQELVALFDAVTSVDTTLTTLDTIPINAIYIHLIKNCPEKVVTHLERVQQFTKSSNDELAQIGTEIFSRLSQTHPQMVQGYTDHLSELIIERNQEIRYRGIAAFINLAYHDPKIAKSYIDKITVGLFDDKYGNHQAAYCCLGAIGRFDYKVAAGLEKTILRGLDDEDSEIQLASLRLLHGVAKHTDSDQCKLLGQYQDPLVEHLGHESSYIQLEAVKTVARIARAYPEHIPPGGNKKLVDAFKNATRSGDFKHIEKEDVYNILANNLTPTGR